MKQKIKISLIVFSLLGVLSQVQAKTLLEELLRKGQEAGEGLIKGGIGMVDKKAQMLIDLRAYLKKNHPGKVEAIIAKLVFRPKAVHALLQVALKHVEIIEQAKAALEKNPEILSDPNIEEGIEGLNRLPWKLQEKDFDAIKDFITKKSGSNVAPMPMVK